MSPSLYIYTASSFVSFSSVTLYVSLSCVLFPLYIGFQLSRQGGSLDARTCDLHWFIKKKITDWIWNQTASNLFLPAKAPPSQEPPQNSILNPYWWLPTKKPNDDACELVYKYEEVEVPMALNASKNSCLLKAGARLPLKMKFMAITNGSDVAKGQRLIIDGGKEDWVFRWGATHMEVDSQGFSLIGSFCLSMHVEQHRIELLPLTWVMNSA